MKARVKATGKIVEVHTCDDADFVDRNGKYYWEHELFFGSLDEHYDDSDYWTRLEHQYAGMAMQAILLFYGNAKVNDDYCAEEAKYYAHTLVEKLKESK